MIFNFNFATEFENEHYPKSIVKLLNQSIENVEIFRYLGDDIKFNDPATGNAEVDLRISIAESKFYELIKKFTKSSHIFMPDLELKPSTDEQNQFNVHPNAKKTYQKWVKKKLRISLHIHKRTDITTL